jgi:DNA-directed RNA polymerase subunit RPC12/RpoP
MTHDLLVRGTAAAKAGEKSEAVRYFTRLLRLDPTPDEQTEAWHWLAELSNNPVEQREYLDELLSRNPGDSRARRKMAALTGDLNPAEIINPDKFQPRQLATPVRIPAQRFACTACGARMVYSADGMELICENCGSRRPVGGLKNRITRHSETNFSAAMATSVGHQIPDGARMLVCQGCGAEFLLPPQVISTNCPYCGSSYATIASADKEIVQPAQLIPFKIPLKQAREFLTTWFKDEGFDEPPAIDSPIGFYIPVWKFAVGGQLTWACSIQKNRVWTPIHDSKILDQPDILVFATRHVSEVSNKMLPTYDLSALVPYNPHYLSDWMAETYQIAVGDASLNARQLVLENEKERIPLQYDSRITNLRVNPASMAVDSYQLILLPIWLSCYTFQGDPFDIAVNGQNGRVVGQQPTGGMTAWISNFFNPRQ